MFKLSSEASLDGAITVENKFIVEYMPYADGDYVKVYLYGLSLAARKGDKDDSLDRLARRLDLDITTVETAIEYWTDQGLMSRLGDEICYFSPRTARPKIKKFDVDKYGEFNRQAQLYISERQIAPNEYNEYYALMEKLNLEWQAMVLIIKYCVDLKGANVSCQYILAVARNLAQDGYRTADAVGDRLDEYGVYYKGLSEVMSVMGKKVDHESVQLYKKWRTEYKFEQEFIVHAAAYVKRGGAPVLDIKLKQYHDLGLFSVDIVDKYEEERKQVYKLAKSVNKILGIYLENVDYEISTYINPWLGMGFEPNAILAAADYCMRNGLKRLGDLDAVLRDYFANGRTTEKEIVKNLEHENRYDGEIEKLFKTLGVKGAVKDVHRAYYANWTEKFGSPEDLIDYACSLAVGKENPLAYMNKLLRDWANADIKTVTGAVTAVADRTADAPQTDADKGRVVYERMSADDLNSMFTRITGDDE